MKKPETTIVMSVYNGEKYLKDAIESMLSQTYADFEFVIVDDGSKDKSLDIISSFNDSRIRLIRNSEQKGLAASLNKGVALALGKYIARMDADDISDRDRLKKQYDFLEAHPDVGVVGTQINIIDERGRFLKKTSKPSDHFIIKWENLFASSMYHPTIMLHKDLLQNNPYREDFKTSSEDHELWSRLLKITKFANLDEPLLNYRLHLKSASKNRTDEEKDRSARVSINNMSEYIQLSQEEENLIKRSKAGEKLRVADLIKMVKLYKKLANAYIQKESLNYSYSAKVGQSLNKIYWQLTKRFAREKLGRILPI